METGQNIKSFKFDAIIGFSITNHSFVHNLTNPYF